MIIVRGLKEIQYFILLILLTACATQPNFNTHDVVSDLSISKAVANIDNYTGKKIIWGGVIISSINIEKGTQIEILAYPLDGNFKPEIYSQSLGRFIVTTPQYLETYDYAQGKLLSVAGEIKTARQGRIGEVDYMYPIVEATQFHLWKSTDGDTGGTFHLGIGVMFGN